MNVYWMFEGLNQWGLILVGFELVGVQISGVWISGGGGGGGGFSLVGVWISRLA